MVTQENLNYEGDALIELMRLRGHGVGDTVTICASVIGRVLLSFTQAEADEFMRHFNEAVRKDIAALAAKNLN